MTRTARTTALAAATVALALLAACSSDSDSDSVEALAPAVATAAATAPANGPSSVVGNGTAWTYIVSDAAGKPTEVGVRMSGAALTGLATESHGEHPQPIVLAFPSGVAAGVLNHVELYWNPAGHEPPGVWDKPHFDYHFYLTDEAAVREIVPTAVDFTTKAARLPDAKYVPADFVAPPGSAVDNTIPGMGLHWLDSTEPPVPGQYVFTETMIHGSYDGAMTFIEPMITLDWLLTKPTLDEPLKEPQAYQRGGLYPTRYLVRYDSARDEYSIALGTFTDRQSS